MDAWDLAVETIQEGRIHADVVDLYRQYKEAEALEEFMKQDTEGLKNLKDEMEERGYSLDVSNSVLKFIEKEQYYFDNKDIGKKFDVIKLVDVYTDERSVEEEEGVERYLKTTVLVFEDSDGKVFDVELNEYRDVEFDSDFNGGEYFLSDSFQIEGRLL